VSGYYRARVRRESMCVGAERVGWMPGTHPNDGEDVECGSQAKSDER